MAAWGRNVKDSCKRLQTNLHPKMAKTTPKQWHGSERDFRSKFFAQHCMCEGIKSPLQVQQPRRAEGLWPQGHSRWSAAEMNILWWDLALAGGGKYFKISTSFSVSYWCLLSVHCLYRFSTRQVVYLGPSHPCLSFLISCIYFKNLIPCITDHKLYFILLIRITLIILMLIRRFINFMRNFNSPSGGIYNMNFHNNVQKKLH